MRRCRYCLEQTTRLECRHCGCPTEPPDRAAEIAAARTDVLLLILQCEANPGPLTARAVEELRECLELLEETGD